MKNIRKSAVAAATALALTLGGVAAAHAEEAAPKLPTDVATQQGLSSEGGKGKDAKAVGSSDKYLGEDGKPSAEVLKNYEADKAATGVQMSSEEKDTNLPKWAKTLRAVTATGLVGSFLGLVVFPIINFLKFQGVIR